MKKMGILGPPGTHSEAAAVYINKFFSEPMELVNFSEIYEVISAVEDGHLDCGFVPVENSLEGSVNITLDTLARSDNLSVVCELIWTVHNNLMAREGVELGHIKKIFSHAQPISQCRNFLRTKCPTAEICTAASTARAAEIVAESDINDAVAAICTARAGQLNNLVTLASDVQDNMNNCTRFFQVCRTDNLSDIEFTHRKDKMLIICQIYGERAGALCEVLEEFAQRSVNMTRIESRPARTKLGDYIFFFDLDMNVKTEIIEESVEAVRQKSIWLKILGTFPVFSS